MRNVVLRCVAILGLLWPGDAGGVAPDRPFSQLAVDNWNVAQGLPHKSVRAIVQGADGYIWVGTVLGLARFDGVAFRVYRPEDTPALPAKQVNALHVDGAGALWIATERGLARFDGRRFEAATLRDGDATFATSVRALVALTDGSLVAGTNDGLFRRRAQSLDFERLAAFGAQRVHALHFGKGGLWVAFDAALVRLDRDDLTERERHAIDMVVAIQEWAGTVWAGTDRALHRLDGGTLVPVRRSDGRDYAWSAKMYVDRDDVMWVGTDDELLRFHRGALLEGVSTDPRVTFSGVFAAYEDEEGNLWLGDYGNGLTRVWNGTAERWSRESGLDENVTTSLGAWRDGTLLVGTNSGMRRFDGTRFVRSPEFDAIGNQPILAILEEDARTWVGTATSLYRVDARGAVRAPGSEALRLGPVRSILRDRSGRLWVAASYGVALEVDGVVQSVAIDRQLGGGQLHAIVEDADGAIHAVGTGGLQRYDGTRFATEPVPDALRVAEPSMMVALDDGDLVVGTRSAALGWRHAGVWQVFDRDDGLPLNTGGVLAVDRAGTLWVGGEYGVYRLPARDLAVYGAGRLPALRATMVLSVTGTVPGAQKAECCTASGTSNVALDRTHAWFTTGDGLVRVPLVATATNAVAPRVRIERLRYSGEWRDVAGPETLALPESARDLELDYTVLSFRDPKSVALRHRLVGYDADWRALDNVLMRRAVYTNLPPGDYAFQVMGGNDAGVWNDEPAELRFSIAPRFHETPWFRALVAAAALLALYAAYALRTMALRRDRDRLEQLVGERTAALDAANRRLQEASETDPLTRLRNRRYLHDHLPADVVALHERLAKTPGSDAVLAFVVADLDHFKRINDRHGHAVGDAVLRQFALGLRATVREDDYLVRWGGEEFVLVLRGRRRGEMEGIVETLRRHVEETSCVGSRGEPLRITTSLGCIEYPLLAEKPGALPWEQYIELADQALYLAKQSGRNTFATCVPGADVAAFLRARVGAPSAVELVSAGAVRFVLREGSGAAPVEGGAGAA